MKKPTKKRRRADDAHARKLTRGLSLRIVALETMLRRCVVDLEEVYGSAEIITAARKLLEGP